MSQPTISAGRAGDLPVGSGRAIRAGGHHIAVFRTAPDSFFAVDALCPHEGYPMAQGYLRDCVLTCAWHNYKFDLRDGRCLLGDEGVTAYPVRVVRGDLLVDVGAAAAAERDPARRLARLEAALDDGDLGRVAREVVRALRAGVDAIDLLGLAARWDALHGEHGPTHALPVAADLAGALCGGLADASAVALAFELALDPNVRRPVRARPAPIEPGADAEARFLAAVEAEDAATAEGLVRGALAGGAAPAEVGGWLLAACSRHFLRFGHPLIYAGKAVDLCARAGAETATDVLPALAHAIVVGTREDTLPAMAFLEERLAEVAVELPEWAARDDDPGWDDRALVTALLDGTKHDAAAAVTAAFTGGAGPRQIAAGIVAGAALRCLRFDPAIELDDSVQDGWLAVTHGLTHAVAAADALRRSGRPDRLRTLWHAAHFVQRNRPLDLPPERREPVVARAGDAAALGRAVLARDAPAALGIAATLLESDPVAVSTTLRDLVIGGHGTLPIVVAHLLKTPHAAFEARPLLPGHRRDLPVLAAVRFAASPHRERRMPRLAAEALRFVGDGKPPRRLVPA